MMVLLPIRVGIRCGVKFVCIYCVCLIGVLVSLFADVVPKNVLDMSS